MRVASSLILFASLASFAAHAADGQAGQPNWTPPAYGVVAPRQTEPKSLFADGFAARKLSPGAKALTAAAVTALQATSFASHIGQVDTTGALGWSPSGNPGRAGDRSFLGDKSMDHGIR
ncbi:hypothetical protein ABIE56_001843 [Luteibacter sp. 621]